MNLPTKRITEVDQVSVPESLDEVYIKQDGAFVRIPLASLLQAYAIYTVQDGQNVYVRGRLLTQLEYNDLPEQEKLDPHTLYLVIDDQSNST